MRLQHAGPLAGFKVIELAHVMLIEGPHATLGQVQPLGLPIKLSATPGGPRHGAPLFGEHTRAVLAEYGYSAPEIAALIAEGAVVAREQDGHPQGGRR